MCEIIIYEPDYLPLGEFDNIKRSFQLGRTCSVTGVVSLVDVVYCGPCHRRCNLSALRRIRLSPGTLCCVGVFSSHLFWRQHL